MSASNSCRSGSAFPRVVGLALALAAIVLSGGCALLLDAASEGDYAVVYEEEFDSPASYAGTYSWLTLDDPNAAVWVADGAIQILIRSEDRFQLSRPEGLTTGDTFRLDVGACLVSGEARAELGVVFYVQEDWDHMRFGIRKDGMMRLRRRANSSWTDLTDWMPCPAINTGLDCNVITVIVNGSHFDFYVNETWVLEATDSTFSGGGIGVIASAQAGEPGTHAAFPIVILSEPI